MTDELKIGSLIEEYAQKKSALEKDLNERINGEVNKLQAETSRKVFSTNNNNIITAYASLLSAVGERAERSPEGLESLLSQAEKIFNSPSVNEPVSTEDVSNLMAGPETSIAVADIASKISPQESPPSLRVFMPENSEVADIASRISPRESQQTQDLPEISSPAGSLPLAEKPLLIYETYKALRNQGLTNSQIKDNYRIERRSLCAFSGTYARCVLKAKKEIPESGEVIIPLEEKPSTGASDEYISRKQAIGIMKSEDAKANRPEITTQGYGWRINSIKNSGKITLQEGKIPLAPFLEALKNFQYHSSQAKSPVSLSPSPLTEEYISPKEAINEVRNVYSHFNTDPASISGKSLRQKISKGIKIGSISTTGAGRQLRINKSSLEQYFVDKFNNTPAETPTLTRKQKNVIYTSLVGYIQGGMSANEALDKSGITGDYQRRAYIAALSRRKVI